MSFDRRKLLAAALGGTALLTTGCMTKPLRPANADGTYCYRIGKSYRPKLTCTPGPVPSAQVESQARDFGASADRLTVYLVRKRWGDTEHVISVSTPGAGPRGGGRHGQGRAPAAGARAALADRHVARRNGGPGNLRQGWRSAGGGGDRPSLGLGQQVPPRARNDRRRPRTHAQPPTGCGRWLKALAAS